VAPGLCSGAKEKEKEGKEMEKREKGNGKGKEKGKRRDYPSTKRARETIETFNVPEQ
jgi:hypothetical protein